MAVPRLRCVSQRGMPDVPRQTLAEGVPAEFNNETPYVRTLKGWEMVPQLFLQSPCLNTSGKQFPKPRWTGHSVAGVVGMSLLLVAWASLTLGASPMEAPAPPAIAPVIGAEYPADLDGNRISDELEQGIGLKGGLSIASAPDAMVKVELIFREPVTQAQIDAFLGLGGRITYLYQAISYGWNGLVPAGSLSLLPAAMGDTLVQVEPVYRFQPYMDMATQTGRVRPVWKAGFAGHAAGIGGSPNTTIGFVGDGVDATHLDLKDRCVYWHDFTDDNEPAPVDFDGHDSMVVGVALGSGQAGGAEAGELRYTMCDPFPWLQHVVEPIVLPSGSATVTAKATWTGGDGRLDFLCWKLGIGDESHGACRQLHLRASPRWSLTNTFTASNTNAFSVGLMYSGSLSFLDNVVINTTVASYPGVGDGFNKFRGVASGCKWAAAKVFDRNGDTTDDLFKAGLDDLVLHRVEKNIKVINISHGLYDEDGYPDESVSLRNKVNSIVNNGIVVVAAAGNSASSSYEADRRMADPPRPPWPSPSAPAAT